MYREPFSVIIPTQSEEGDPTMNRYLTYQDGELLFEDVALSEIAQEMYTPFYAYSKAAILEKVEALKQAFADAKPMLAFSLRALDTTLILKMLLEKGCAVEVENLTEIQRAQKAGFEPTGMILNSYGLPDQELAAILKKKPLFINIGNLFELQPLNKIAAELDIGVRIGLKINPGIDVGGFFGTNTGSPTSRFGLRKDEIDLALALIKKLPQLNLVALSSDLGSQVVQLAPWIKMSEDMAKLYKEIGSQGFNLEYLDLGGGFPGDYGKSDHLDIKKIARNIVPALKDLDCRLVLEPGRYFTAEAGILVTSVLGTRDVGSKTFVFTDAGFSEFPRSALYRLSHEVVNVKTEPVCAEQPATALGGDTLEEPISVGSPATVGAGESVGDFGVSGGIMAQAAQADSVGYSSKPVGKPATVDVVGPGGEGLDFLAQDVELCIPKRGELLAVLNVGAYGRTLSSNYGSRLRPPEVLIERDKFEIIRARESIEDLVACDMTESELET
jgi:diaminopimelate decarboxylase